MVRLASNARRPAVAAALSLVLLLLLSGCIWSERPLLFDKLGSPDTPLLANRTYAAFKYSEGPQAQEPKAEGNGYLTLQDGVYSLTQGSNGKLTFRLFHISRIVPEVFGNETARFYVIESIVDNLQNGSSKSRYMYDYIYLDDGFFSIHPQSCKELENFAKLDIFDQEEIDENDCQLLSFKEIQRATVSMMLRMSDRKDQKNFSAKTIFMLKI